MDKKIRWSIVTRKTGRGFNSHRLHQKHISVSVFLMGAIRIRQATENSGEDQTMNAVCQNRVQKIIANDDYYKDIALSA